MTGGGPNPNFYDSRYLGPDSAIVEDLDLEAGETLSLEFEHVENGRLDEHIGQTYIFHNRVEIEHQNGDKYRLRRHVITQDTWTSTGTRRATKIDGSNGDVDKGWPGDKDYFIKEYNSLSWVKESDVSADEWEDCWYELMSFEPSTTATEGEQLADVTLTALPYYGDAPMGTVYNDEDGILDVEKENRFAYIQADLAVELPGIEGGGRVQQALHRVRRSKLERRLRPTLCRAGSLADATLCISQGCMALHAADLTARLTSASTKVRPPTCPTQWAGTSGSSATVGKVRRTSRAMPTVVLAYECTTPGFNTRAAASSLCSPDYKGRIKVEHMNSDGTFTDKTFNTQWRLRPQAHGQPLLQQLYSRPSRVRNVGHYRLREAQI